MTLNHDYALRGNRCTINQKKPCNLSKYGRIECRKIIQSGPGNTRIYCDKELVVVRAQTLAPAQPIYCNAKHGSKHKIFSKTSWIGICGNSHQHNDCEKLIICCECMEKAIGGAPWVHRQDRYEYSTEYYEHYYTYLPKKRK